MEALYITWYTNQNCSVPRGRCVPAAEISADGLAELKGDDDLTVWDAMTADEIREIAEGIPSNVRGGLDLALASLPEREVYAVIDEPRGDNVRHEVSMRRRYKAAMRGLDGRDVRVYSAAIPGVCSYGLQHWFDRARNDYGQIDLINPIYIVHTIEELSEDEAAAVDRLLGVAND